MTGRQDRISKRPTTAVERGNALLREFEAAK
jgi:hypothetical protein